MWNLNKTWLMKPVPTRTANSQMIFKSECFLSSNCDGTDPTFTLRQPGQYEREKRASERVSEQCL